MGPGAPRGEHRAGKGGAQEVRARRLRGRLVADKASDPADVRAARAQRAAQCDHHRATAGCCGGRAGRAPLPRAAQGALRPHGTAVAGGNRRELAASHGDRALGRWLVPGKGTAVGEVVRAAFFVPRLDAPRLVKNVLEFVPQAGVVPRLPEAECRELPGICLASRHAHDELPGAFQANRARPVDSVGDQLMGGAARKDGIGRA
mmetsp:Transcript_77202/g.213460  ORF Transcript_77202/g.213460 Transcript_77202/m.213460 type:complete len:204 (+) Transcript_77202:177-788(+)